MRALAVQGFEVIEGSRTLAQLGPLITVGLARSLSAQRAGAGDRRVVCRDARRARPRPTTVRIDRPVAHIAEAAIVLRVGDVARAVALRLEWAHQHWRATEFFLL
ncbi:Rv3235 family protein [Leucobacter soli]|uniref:Rv3235 family protein n=1 Tax=Leucobacter soli TaxID=2812850 RepID=UPI0036225D83